MTWHILHNRVKPQSFPIHTENGYDSLYLILIILMFCKFWGMDTPGGKLPIPFWYPRSCKFFSLGQFPTPVCTPWYKYQMVATDCLPVSRLKNLERVVIDWLNPVCLVPFFCLGVQLVGLNHVQYVH